MFRAEIEMTENDLYKFDLIENYKPDLMENNKIVFYTTQGGTNSPETRIKCFIDKALCILSLVPIGKSADLGLDENVTSDSLKKLLNKETVCNGVFNYELKLKGTVSGIEQDCILFNVSQLIIMPPKSS